SMGAVIGSLYASGYTGKQLDSIFQATDFNTLLQDELPRNVKTFYEKEQSKKYVVTLPFSNFNISFPSGLSHGQNVYNLISRLTAHLQGVHDFENLPIPFFCIATNIETGEEVLLDEGSLPLAVSASSAIPSLFSPVEVNGKMLVDGGVVNNYPVREIKKMGADIVIGVNVQDSLSGKENLNGVLEILNQINNFRGIETMKEKKALTDVYIRPDISDYTILSFDEGKEIIEKGETAAKKKIEELRQIINKQSGPYKRKKIQPTDSIFIESVRITGDQNYPRSYIRGKLRIAEKKNATYRDLMNGINNLSATGNFKRIDYYLDPQEKGSDLVIHLKESEQKTFLKFALHYDDLYKSSFLLNFTHKSLLFNNDITSLDFILGDNLRYNFNYFIDKGRYWSIGLSSQYNHFEKDVDFDFVRKLAEIGEFNVNQVEIEYSDFTNRIFLETFFLQDFRFGLGAEHKYMKIKTETILEESEIENPMPFTILEETNLFSAMGYLELDSYDKKYFPHSGSYFMGDFHAYLLSAKPSEDFEQFAILKGKFAKAFPFSEKFTFRASMEGGFRFGENDSQILNFFLGGYGNQPVNNLVPFYGYDFLEISGDSYIKTLFELDFEFMRKNHLIASYNLANVQDHLFENSNWFELPEYSGIAIGYGMETFIGPLEVKYSFSPETSENYWNFVVGFWF
ncbi:MAG TPA: patatin-like phospholipase family protein, partial [Flavobacteriaceae bacterium]|nr:patatin-like phospholipase family protein [Flavobacteriaceae bacterium]